MRDKSFLLKRRDELKAELARLNSDMNSKKVQCNGTFGKLGSMYSVFYSPDLMLAVTITGQLNLLCLIDEIEKRSGGVVLSANTDGITVMYAATQRDNVIDAIKENVARTGFEYEENRYAVLAMKDVNSYIAVTAPGEIVVVSPEGVKVDMAKGGKVKAKGLYASNRAEENPLFLMKNATMEVCSRAAAEYLKNGTLPGEFIKTCTDPRDFVSIRNVKGGGIQFEKMVEVDDWVCVLDLGTKDNQWESPSTGKKATRKSRPNPVEVGQGGTPFGRVARWYMTREALPPICYVGSGNKVPKTEGARVCMTLPEALPADIDLEWYERETISMLADMGVSINGDEE